MIVSKKHKRPALGTKVFKKISDIPAADWHRVYPEVIESYDFYRTLDASGLPRFEIFYIAVYERKNMVGATACFIVDYPLDTSINGPLRRVTNSIRKLAPGIFSLKAVVCGTPMAQGRIGFRGDAAAVMDAITRRMERVARKYKAPILAFKDFDAAYRKDLGALKDSGFVRIDSLPNTMLDVKYKDFEGYLKTLSAANRYDLRRKFKKVDSSSGLEMKITDSPAEDELRRIYDLYLGIVAKHEMGFEVLPREFFDRLHLNMPGKTKYFLWSMDGRIVMFLLALVSKDLFIDYYVGFDYSVAHEYHLYFVKFRQTLKWCIDNKIPQYEMGITGYEPKRRLGFEFVPLDIYAKLRVRALRPAFKILCSLLKFENFDPDLKAARKRMSR